ncbi:hypothetical protein SAMN05216266_1534, partial [Amycolatopsis marina]
PIMNPIQLPHHHIDHHNDDLPHDDQLPLQY